MQGEYIHTFWAPDTPMSTRAQTISARAWKLDMGLNKKGKEGSRELACELYPQCADMMKCALAPTAVSRGFYQGIALPSCEP